MYSCCVRFYLIGDEKNLFSIIKNIPPFKHFSHKFCSSTQPDAALLHSSDVIIACVKGEPEAEAVRAVIKEKKDDAELIVIAEKESVHMLMDMSEDIKDIWILPMTKD